MRVLVTGSDGFIGSLVLGRLEEQGHTAIGFDLPDDVLDASALTPYGECDAAIHLAADKYAGNGEDDPAGVTQLNVQGTANVVDILPRVILASTCKAAAPITCYGASKLIAERIVLNAGGSVVRLVNVLGSTGSVTEIWDAIPEDEPLPVTDCERMFMDPRATAKLLVDALERPPGRYGPNVGRRWRMDEVARDLYPGRPQSYLPLRRGDRPVESLTHAWETEVWLDPETVEIVDCWQRQPLSAAA